ncbi:MAG: hypothetical protein K6E47_06645 [Lachnospiraceae bacterium]|nr:hypothetical protein [Lachnospiraceae bacterium]
MSENNYEPFEKVDLLAPVELTAISGLESPFEAPVPSDTDSAKDTGKGDIGEEYSDNLRVDPNFLFREDEELKKKLEEDRNRKTKLFIAVTAFVVMFILAFSFMRGVMGNIAKKSEETKADLPSVVTIKDSPIQGYYKQDPVYGILEYDSADRLDSELVTFNPDIIEYTGAYQRTLYFRISPKQENVAVQVNVQMFDRYGNTIGNESGSKMAIAKGSHGIIPVTFQIDPLMDLNDVTYKISSSAYEIQGEPSYNKITKLELPPDGYMRIYMEGDKYLNKEAYVVSYKDEKIISVDRYSADILETSAILYCDIGTDYTRCEVYY